MWTSQGNSQVVLRTEGQIIPASCFPAPRVPICGLHSISQILPLGAYNLGQWRKTARWSKSSFGSSEGASCDGDTSKGILTKPILRCDFDCIFGWLASINSSLFSRLRYPNLPAAFMGSLFFSPNKFPFFQVSHIGFYCLHPMIGVLVRCFWPWPWSPYVVNSLSTVSRDAFRSYFCIILKISSSTWSVFFIILWYP